MGRDIIVKLGTTYFNLTVALPAVGSTACFLALALQITEDEPAQSPIRYHITILILHVTEYRMRLVTETQ